MSLIRDFIDKIRRKRASPPIITTPWGNVTESARKHAALNMREDADLRYRIVARLAQDFDGDWAKGLAEAKRRYPEGFDA